MQLSTAALNVGKTKQVELEILLLPKQIDFLFDIAVKNYPIGQLVLV